MELVHTETKDGITYRLYIEQDELQVRGNAVVSDDPKADKRTEDRIIKRLDDGDTWAWAQTKVTASIDGVDIEGEDYLGACSYRNAKDFIRKSGYWDDMKSEAKDQLFDKLAKAAEAWKAHVK